MIAFTSPSSRAPLVVLAAAMLASACSSVDLGPRYDPPPVRMPQATTPAPAPLPPIAQPSAVPPAQPMPQPLPWVMAYDTRPLITLTEKAAFLERAADEKFVLFFEHDNVNQCGRLERTEKGVRLAATLPLSDLG